jgi:PBP1b-binding outer membrane lipoprotein LpoB
MKIQKLLTLTVTALIFASCSTTRPVNYGLEQQQTDKQEVITQSLFDSQDRTISEQDIQRLLRGKIIIPDTIRIAVFKYASTSMNRYYSYNLNDEEFLKTQQSYIDTLVTQLKTSDKVKKVIMVPSIMTSKYPNITQLRESAVRLQADLLLVFSINSDIYYKYKAFQKNEAKAFATCETILMDTRTGVIPHSSVITRENLVSREQEDWTNEETRKRAENGAVILTLLETGKSVSEFLDYE